VPTGYWKKRLYAKDPLLPIVCIRTDSRKEKEYYDSFNELINMIYHGITPHVNYAHVHSLIPRRNLPLRFEGNHMDIAYLTLGRTLVQMQVHITPVRRIPKKYLGENLFREPIPGD
jgi:hypothetical protein